MCLLFYEIKFVSVWLFSEKVTSLSKLWPVVHLEKDSRKVIAPIFLWMFFGKELGNWNKNKFVLFVPKLSSLCVIFLCIQIVYHSTVELGGCQVGSSQVWANFIEI